ncbi:hypothetical protein D3C81_2186070 [compost metagenome]
MLEVIEIDFIPAVLLEPLYGEQVWEAFGDEPGNEMTQCSQLVEGDAILGRYNNLHTRCTRGLRDRGKAE